VCLYSQARDTFCLQPTTSRRWLWRTTEIIQIVYHIHYL
jgi:hypothetical protein